MIRNFYDKIIKNLPENVSIMGRDRFFNSVVLISIVNLNGVDHFLFQKRAKNIRQGGEICFPGGGFDPEKDKNAEETVIRETIEELGINKDKIEIGGKFDSIVNSIGTFIEVFVGSLNIHDISELHINHKEVEKILLVPVSYFKNNRPEEYKLRVEIHPTYINEEGEEITLFPAKELGVPPKYWKFWGGKSHTVYVYRTHGEVIWGITGQIIAELMKRI